MRYTPLATPNETDVSPFTYGTSVYKPVDDPAAWPCLNNRDAKPDEVAALSAKLAYLQRMADEVGEKLTANLDDVQHLAEIAEDEGMGTLCFLLPVSLPGQIFGSLRAASTLVENKDYAAAVAHLRYAEVALRHVNTWGQGKVEVTVPGALGLEAGDKASVVIETDVELVSNGSRLVEKVERTTRLLEDD